MIFFLLLLCINFDILQEVSHLICSAGGESITKLAKVRKTQGLTQRKLAVMSGVHRVLIAKYETGVISPNVRNLKRLADALNGYNKNA